MLAMDVNDDAGSLPPRGVLGFIASMLAPTYRGPFARFFQFRPVRFAVIDSTLC
jgi:hypothetical protein